MRLFRLQRRTAAIVLQRLLLCFLCFSSYHVFAQSSQVSGVVRDSAGGPLAGATVMVKGTKVATVTSVEGAFAVTAGNNAVLVVTAIGYESQEVPVGGQSNITIAMKPLFNTLNDVVVIGYGTQRKKDLTGSIATVNIAEAKKLSTNDINNLLQGRAAGVQVTSGGEPGAAPGVRIRGFNTVGSSSPFYVVDGVPVGTSIAIYLPQRNHNICKRQHCQLSYHSTKRHSPKSSRIGCKNYFIQRGQHTV